MFRASLQRKLLGVMLLTALVSVVVALAAMIGYDLRTYHAVWVDDISTQAELVGRTAAPALAFDDAQVAQEDLALLRLQPKVLAAALYTARGELFASYSADGVPRGSPPAPEPDGARVEGNELLVFKRIVENGRGAGTVFVRARYELLDRVRHYAGIALAVSTLAMLAALFVSAWLQRIVTRPILAVGKVAREVVTHADFSRRAQRISNDEVGALVEAFNNLLSEIEQRTSALEATNRDKQREVEERRRAQQEVMRLNEELERRVHERTAQLEISNRDLTVASAQAEKANRAKSEFLSSMSHELRTPLNAIIGFGQLLANEARANTPEQRQMYVGHIVKAGDHLLALINEILDLARIESGRLSLSLETVALDDLLRECRTMSQPQAAERDVQLLFPQAGDVHVAADRIRLKQVLLNLLSNAIKYNRKHGAVVVEWTRPTPQRVRLSVRDTGAGLQPEQLAELFQPFNRLGQEATAIEGTGIGLVVTKRLVEMMGGEIGVRSTPGAGSVFWIDLNGAGPSAANIAPHADTGAAAVAATPVDATIATVLCVDDNPASLRLVEEVLRLRADLCVLSAQDGHVGVELARLHHPQVILMDNNMPGMTGMEAQAILRADPRTADIPVIALTASAMPEAVAQGLAAGFFRYLTKPVNIAKLADAVDSALAWSRQRQRTQQGAQ
jgi:signal transduction histidine kinase/AmiR/NasT family two-component response regulator